MTRASVREYAARQRERYRTLRSRLERPIEPGESSSAEAERILYHTLMSAIGAGLIRTLEDALRVMRHASQPLRPMGAEWLERQARALKLVDIGSTIPRLAAAAAEPKGRTRACRWEAIDRR